MAETIFAKIIRGEIPCHKVYEDEHVFAFLDINPVSPGHCLVLPKEEAATLDQLSEASAAALGRALPKICRAVMAVTGADGYNILQNNGEAAYQVVQHVHFHVIPKYEGGKGLGLVWRTSELDHQEGADIAARLRDELGA